MTTTTTGRRYHGALALIVAACAVILPAHAAASAPAYAGALFRNGTHFCSGAVVASPSGDTVITAAHCAYGRTGLYFVPGFNGTRPLGTWRVTRVTVDPRWAANRNPAYDVAFLRVADLNGRTLRSATGSAVVLAASTYLPRSVTVTGWPDGVSRPVSDLVTARRFSATQMVFDHAGYPNGTSGGPWVTGDGHVIGVIGGYQQGGNVSWISYSSRFGAWTATVLAGA